MKHILQWKFIFIMFICMFCGLASMAAAEAIIFGKMAGMTAEESEVMVASNSVYFNILFCFVMIVTFLLLSRRIIRRIEKMNENVERIAGGNIELLEDDRSKDELGSLSKNINGMARKLQGSLEKEREMVCSVAHDLRTPITSIKGYARLLEKSNELTDEERKYATIIEEKSVALSSQIEELLEYSVLQFEEKEYTFETLDIGQLLEQVVVELIPELDEAGMTFSIQGNKGGCLVQCNQMLMVRLFENLLNNCLRYGKEGKRIDIEMNKDDKLCHLQISNYSSSLSEAELSHLFEAFYQGKDAAEYRTESQGLGLAIVRKIVNIHGGNICVKYDENLRKIMFCVELPIA